MKNNTRILSHFLLGFSLIFLLSSCNTSVYKALQKGSLENPEFTETIDFEVRRGLIILPVEINGKSFRFLLDTGAPSGISHEVQSEMNFKTLSKGNIVDSEGSRQKIKYVKIDRISLGNTAFLDQTAFVSSFTQNPAIGCLDIDGIIGSNLMRYCNWEIDFPNKKITFSSKPLQDKNQSYESVKFKADYQYDMSFDIKTEGLTISNMKVDYGSNGYLSLPEKIITTLEEKGALEKTFDVEGFSQSGITGTVSHAKQKIGYLDTVFFNNLQFYDALIKQGSSALIGTGLLSQRVVIIDWTNRQLHFENTPPPAKDKTTFGMTVAIKKDGLLYVQSVIRGSSAYEKGIKPNMQVLKYGDFDFTGQSTFCDYFLEDNDAKQISVELIDFDGKQQKFNLEKRLLKE